MVAERRDRIVEYVGPKLMVTRDELPNFEDGHWIAEPKMDGFWCMATIADGRIAGLTSRTGLPLDGAHGGDLTGAKVGHDGLHGLLCGELTADTVNGERCGTRRLHLFDAIEWCGIDLRRRTCDERRQGLELIQSELVKHLSDPTILPVVERTGSGFQSFYDEVIADGGEGICLKRRDSLYVRRNSDGKVDFWHRCKPIRTVDYVVMGHGLATKGTPNLELGLYKKVKTGTKLVKVCTVAFVSKTMRGQQVTAASLVGSVLECQGYEIWPSGALRSAQIVRVRTDKMPTDCTYAAVAAEHGAAMKEE
jgi:ATP-dependent DNA ligase